jgi:hypothetical protein
VEKSPTGNNFVASAGEEKLVDKASHADICRRLKDCEHIMVEGAMHEILMETDDRRAEFWSGSDVMRNCLVAFNSAWNGGGRFVRTQRLSAPPPSRATI